MAKLYITLMVFGGRRGLPAWIASAPAWEGAALGGAFESLLEPIEFREGGWGRGEQSEPDGKT